MISFLFAAFLPAALAAVTETAAPITGTSAPAPVTQVEASEVTAPAEVVSDIPNDDELAELFELSLHEKQDVSVSTASKYAQRVRKTPANIVVIDHDEIRKNRYRTLGDVLRGVAGMFVVNDGIYDLLNVRGFGLLYDLNSRVLVLLNGHTMNSGLGTGSVHDFHVDMQSIERIEIIKGPGSSIYGTGAFFGVINVITLDAESPDANRVALTGNMPGPGGELNVSNGGRTGDFKWYATGKALRDNGLEKYFAQYDPAVPGATDRAGYGGRTRFDRDTIGGAYGRLGWKDFSFAAYAGHREKQVPDAQFEADFHTRTNVNVEQRYFAEAAYSHVFGRAKVSARIFGDYGRWEDYLRYTGYGGLYRDIIDDRYAGAEVRTLFTLPYGNRLITGFESSRHAAALPSDFRAAFQEAWANGKMHWYTTANLYAQDDWEINRYVAVSGGGQLNTNTLYASKLMPRAALIVTPGETQTLKLLYGQGIRQPTVYERFFSDFNSYAANPDVDPEVIKTVEAAYEIYPTSRLQVKASIFRNTFDHLISDSEVEISPGQFRSMFVNTRGFNSRGAELTLISELPANWRAQINGTLQEVLAQADNTRANSSPAFLANLLVTGPLLSPDLEAATDWHFVSRRAIDHHAYEVADYTVGNATLSYKTPWQPLETSLRVTNVLDRVYRDLVSTDHDPIRTMQQRPRTAYLRADVSY